MECKQPNRFQFSLRSLLVVVTVIACVCGYFALQQQTARDRLVLRARLESLGANFIPSDSVGEPYSSKIQVPAIQRMMGDTGIFAIELSNELQPYEEELKRTFPEAHILTQRDSDKYLSEENKHRVFEPLNLTPEEIATFKKLGPLRHNPLCD